MKYRYLLFFLFFILPTLVIAQTEETLTLVTHDSFSMSEGLLEQFEEETGIRVQILRAGDAGQVVNQAVLTRNNPLGDVLFGIDNTFLSRGLNADIFLPYQSPALEEVPEDFILDAEHRVTPIDYGDVCLNYDIAYFEENDLEIPQNLADLILPEYRGLLVAMNPATSSPGLAFLLATISVFGEEGEYTYLDFWADLVANEALIVEGWTEAYFTYFTTGGGDGTYPLVVSYASSPPFTVDEETGLAATASIVADMTCFRQIEFAGILAGTQKADLAEQFIDFMLGQAFQEEVPLQMYVFPVNQQAVLPELFSEYAQIPDVPVEMSYEDIELNRERWLRAWSEVVLR